ncbi:MAG: hypothetical protein HOP28_15840 [Gemmatimonadales bacterium]|nr:hypothetical protein [Gemmatimonadales bacterium]
MKFALHGNLEHASILDGLQNAFQLVLTNIQLDFDPDSPAKAVLQDDIGPVCGDEGVFGSNMDETLLENGGGLGCNALLQGTMRWGLARLTPPQKLTLRLLQIGLYVRLRTPSVGCLQRPELVE